MAIPRRVLAGPSARPDGWLNLPPHDDPRPFADVLRDWIARHHLTAYRAAQILRVREGLIPGWLAGARVTHEYGLRCAMSLHDAQAMSSPIRTSI